MSRYDIVRINYRQWVSCLLIHIVCQHAYFARTLLFGHDNCGFSEINFSVCRFPGNYANYFAHDFIFCIKLVLTISIRNLCFGRLFDLALEFDNVLVTSVYFGREFREFYVYNFNRKGVFELRQTYTA